MLGSTTRDLPLAPKLGSWHVLGWVVFLVLLNITSITLANKVLLHLVFPRCKVISVTLFTGERADHLIIPHGRNVFSSSSSVFDEPVLLKCMGNL